MIIIRKDERLKEPTGDQKRENNQCNTRNW